MDNSKKNYLYDDEPSVNSVIRAILRICIDAIHARTLPSFAYLTVPEYLYEDLELDYDELCVELQNAFDGNVLINYSVDNGPLELSMRIKPGYMQGGRIEMKTNSAIERMNDIISRAKQITEDNEQRMYEAFDDIVELCLSKLESSDDPRNVIIEIPNDLLKKYGKDLRTLSGDLSIFFKEADGRVSFLDGYEADNIIIVNIETE